MTLEDIATYCQVRKCRVRIGSPESGFIVVDADGLADRLSNYRRFLALNELSELPDTRKVLGLASQFHVESGPEHRLLDRAGFELELKKVLDFVDA